MSKKKRPPMDGTRIREYLSKDVDALLATYNQFETLLPHPDHAGAAHPGEEGRYVEALLRDYLRKYLPGHLDVGTGFVMRPAVKTGENGRERRGGTDSHSTQLDILIFNSAQYPVFQRLSENVIVPPEAVIGIVSVKKTLRRTNVEKECQALSAASQLCHCLDNQNQPIRGPFLAILSMDTEDSIGDKLPDRVWSEISRAYPTKPLPMFDDVVGYVGVLRRGSAFKARPKGNPPTDAKFVWHTHSDADVHLGLQFVLTGILSVFYDVTRNQIRRPGFTGFESGRPHERDLGAIQVGGLRR